MKVKLICMDLDGTLFSHHSEIPKINIDALHECARRGIKLALVSGRGCPFIRRVAQKIGVDMAIVSANGGRIEAGIDGPTVFEGTFSEDEGRFVMNAMLSADVNFEAYTRDVNYIARIELAPENHLKSLDMYVKAGDVRAEYDLNKMIDEAPGRAYKFVAFTKDQEAFRRAEKALDENGIRHCSSSGSNLEVMPEGVDKGEAVRRLSTYFGIDIKETMAFGDYTNDLDMLRAVHYPVAMQNAVDEVKTIAKYIAPPNTEGGVGRFIFENVLKE